MVNRNIFAERLRTLRKSKQLTQKQLGEELGLVKQTVNNWEMSLSIPSLDIAYGLADYFGVSLDYLVGRTDNPKGGI